MVAATLPPPPAPVTITAPAAPPAMDESTLRKEIQGEVARQLRAFGPAGACVGGCYSLSWCYLPVGP